MTKVHLDAPARQYHQGSAQTHSFLKLLDAVADRGANRSIERLRVNQTHDASIGSWGDREKLQHLEFQLEEVAQLPTVEPAAELPRRRRGYPVLRRHHQEPMRAQMAAKLGDEGPVIGHVREHLQGDDDIEAAPSKSKPMKSPATNLTSGARPRTSWDRSVPVTWPNLVNCGQSLPAPQPTSRIGDRSDAAHPAIRNDLGLPSGHLVERLLAVRGIPLVPEALLQGNRGVASHAVTPGRDN